MKKRCGFVNIFMTICLVAIIAIGVFLPFVNADFGSSNSVNNGLNIAAADAPSGTNTNYGQFADNSTYVITSPSKITSANVVDDTEVITIDTSEKHGESKKNPYVIDNETRWNQLVTDGASDNSTTLGKYYVLAKDLDFSSFTNTQFQPVNYFNGTFYGLGHTLSSLRVTTDVLSDRIGVFNYAKNAVITDLNIKDFVVNQTSSSKVITMGGLVAESAAAKLLNCHTDMTVSRLGVNLTGRFGGIVGICSDKTSSSAMDLLIYRCSSNLNVTSTSTTLNSVYMRVGGIIGLVGEQCRSKVWNCYAEVNADITGNSSYYSGSIIGSLIYPKQEASIENCAGKIDAGSLQKATGDCTDPVSYMAMSLLSIYVSSNNYNSDLPQLTVKNTYTIGEVTHNNVQHQLYAIMSNKAYVSVSNTKKTFYNVYSGINEPATPGGFVYFSAYDKNNSAYGSRRYDVPEQIRDSKLNESDMWTEADTELPPNIWTNTAALRSGYSVDNTPLKNDKITTKDFEVKLYNKTASGKTLLKTETYNYGDKPSIPNPSDETGLTFVGYTFDANKTADTNLNNGLLNGTYYGNLELYAVWDVDDTKVTKSLTVTGTTLTDGKYTVGYGNTIKLNSSITSTYTNADMKIEQEWRRKDNNTGLASAVSHDASLTVANVAESGEYTLYYKIYGSDELILRNIEWRIAGTSSTVNVEITPAPVTVKSFAFASGQRAFVNKPMSELTPNPTVVYINGTSETAVKGTAIWGGTDALKNVTDEDLDGDGFKDGKMKRKITFAPDNSNYQTLKDYEIEIPIEYLTISFVLSHNLGTYKSNIEYKQNYNFNQIANFFDLALKDFDKEALSGFVPKLTIKGSQYELDSLRNNSKNALTAADTADNLTIDVTFVPGSYTVTFDANLDSGGSPTTATYSYGQFVIKPSTPTNGTKTFFGWYYDIFNDEGNRIDEKAWNFESDVVTKNITLTAKWLEPSRLLSIKVTTKSGAKFMAQTQLDLTKIIVEATFECDLPGGGKQNQTVEVPIDSTNITLEYVGNISGDNLLHVRVGGKTNVKVTYTTTIKSNTVSATDKDFEITVTPILVSTDSWTFKDASFVHDGGLKKIIPIGSYDKTKISGVTIKYINPITQQEFDENGVSEIGDYIAIATFTPISADFKVEERRANLKISEAATEVGVTWDKTSFVYNGKKQFPTPTFTDASGNVLDLEYTVSGVDNAIGVGNYKLKIELTTSGYSIKSGQDSISFSITKATLPAPTVKSETNIIYIGDNINIGEFLDGFNPDIMEFVSGGTGFNAESYTAVIKFKQSASANCAWESGSATVNVKWEIKKATAIASWGKYKFVWDGSAHLPEVVGILDIFATDQPAINLNDLIFEGDINASEMGAYTVTVRIPSTVEWFKNYTLENASFDFVIVPNENVELISIVWDKNLVFVYNGELQAPSYTVVDMDGNPVDPSVLDSILFEIPTSKWAGDYTAKATVKTGANYFIRSGGTCTYKITLNAAGEGTNPGDKGGGKDGSDILQKIKDLVDSGFPLWQIATMAVAGLLTLIFLIKSIQYGKRKKQIVGANKQKNNGVKVAGLMPIFSTEVVLAGLSNQIWSIMAFSFVGLALIMFIAALITRKQWKKALRLQSEQNPQGFQQYGGQNQLVPGGQYSQGQFAPYPQGSFDGASLIEEMRREMETQRREMEERHREEMARRDEEQAKRDEAMKLMLANMMGRQQGMDNGEMPMYGSIDDTDLLVQKVIAGLLPAVQQMMPDNTAYLTAPAYEESEELKNLVEVQNEQMRSMSEKIDELQNQLAAQITPASQGNVNLDDLAQKVSEKIVPTTNNTTIVQGASADEMQAMADEVNTLRQQVAILSQSQLDSSVLDEYDDDDFDDEEEWDSILDEEDDDFVEAVIIEEDGTVKKTSPNFRMRLKQSSDKNREWYAVIKNMFCSQKGVTYRVCKRVEKIRYQGQVIGVIGIAKRSIKLWLALKPYEYDARRYHHKDVSDKPRFVDVPMYVRVGSDRALTRAQELILALFQELNMEARKRYNDRSIQELIFTLKHNRLLTNKQNKQLLCEVMHVHDCDVLDDETAEKCIEAKNVDFIDDSVIETVKLDDIDAAFQDGNRITLERLKKVGLVSEECTGYTVTADKRLTKPLIIVANDFTLTAVKLIALTGGRAIRLVQI